MTHTVLSCSTAVSPPQCNSEDGDCSSSIGAHYEHSCDHFTIAMPFYYCNTYHFIYCVLSQAAAAWLACVASSMYRERPRSWHPLESAWRTSGLHGATVFCRDDWSQCGERATCGRSARVTASVKRNYIYGLLGCIPGCCGRNRAAPWPEAPCPALRQY